MLDILLIYMITHDNAQIKNLNATLSEKDFFLSKEGNIFSELYEYYKDGNEEDWKNFLKGSKVYPIVPTNVI